MQGLAESLFPRSSKLAGLNQFHPRALLGAGLDVASLPGRAYASLGRMDDETYMQALGRTGPRYAVGQGEGDEMADAMLRDPSLPISALGSVAWKGLGNISRAVLDAGLGSGIGAADQYSQGERVGLGGLLGGAALGALPSVAIPGKARMAQTVMVDHPTLRKYGLTPEKGVTLYHGSPREFDKFDLSKAGSQRAMTEGWGAYFTADKSNAKAFGGNIIDLNLSSNDLQRVIDLQAPMSEQTAFIQNSLSKLSQSVADPEDAMMRIQTMARDPMYKGYFTGDIGKSLWDYEKMRSLILSDRYINTPVGNILKGHFLPQDVSGYSLVKRAEGSMSGSSKQGNKWLNDYGVIGYTMPSSRDILAKNKNTANAVIFDPEILSRFDGSSGSSPRPVTFTQALGNRLSTGARDATVRKYLSDGRQEQVGGPVPTGLGGFLMASPGDTPYTRRTR